MNTTGNIGNAVEGNSGRKSYDGDDGYRTIATYQDACASGRYDEQETNRIANGRLISLAPELYDELENARTIIAGEAPQYGEALKRIDALLARARV